MSKSTVKSPTDEMLDFLETEYTHRMHEYDKEVATKDLIVLLMKLGVKSAGGQGYNHWVLDTADVK